MKEFLFTQKRPSLRLAGIIVLLITFINGYAQPYSNVLKDLKLDPSAPADLWELAIPSDVSGGSHGSEMFTRNNKLI